MAREDGGIDPIVEPAVSVTGSNPQRPGAPARTGNHPFRDKLLARIRESRDARPDEATSPSEAREKDRFGSFGGLSEELERVARAPTSSPRRSKLRLGDA